MTIKTERLFLRRSGRTLISMRSWKATKQINSAFCFSNTELKRLWAEVDIRNIPSQKMLEKCGYKQEGLIRQGKMVNTWCDYFIYGKLVTD